jgi:sortase A
MVDERRRWSRRVAVALVAIGIGCLGWSGVASLTAARFQREQAAALHRMRTTVPVTATAPPTTAAPGAVIGSLSIPRLHVSAVVLEGDDQATLDVAIGHLPDTPLPWNGGNSALAAHRDTFFRPLKHILVGDELHFSTVYGDLSYRVRETKVVGAQDVWVLDPTERSTLTLITCYPFEHIGPAPQRFVVRAERVAAADAQWWSKGAGGPQSGESGQGGFPATSEDMRPDGSRDVRALTLTG